MSTFDNAPPLDDWVCEPKACPLPDCGYCKPPPTIGPHITLGAE